MNYKDFFSFFRENRKASVIYLQNMMDKLSVYFMKLDHCTCKCKWRHIRITNKVRRDQIIVNGKLNKILLRAFVVFGKIFKKKKNMCIILFAATL